MLNRASLSGKTPKKWLSGDARCRSIDMDISVSMDAFDPSHLSKVIPGAKKFDLTKDTVSGSLRLGGRGKDDFFFVGHASVHRAGESPHYHLTIRATAVEKGYAANPALPKIADFFSAIAQGVKDPDDVYIHVVGTHRYPREWWRKKSEWDLPVPLSGAGERVEAELTGVEVTYKTETTTETVVVSATGSTFSVNTIFSLPGPVAPDLFRAAVEHSAELGNRLFQQAKDEP